MISKAMNSMQNAILIAMIAHKGQKRKDETPYIDHCRRVSFIALNASSEEAGIVGMLHDSIEDGGGLVNPFLLSSFFCDEIVEAVDAISRRINEPYFNYIERVKGNKIARIVKLIDLQDNISTLDEVKYSSLYERYNKAIAILSKPFPYTDNHKEDKDEKSITDRDLSQ